VTYKVNIFGKAFAHVRNYLRQEKHMYDTNKNIDENDTNKLLIYKKNQFELLYAFNYSRFYFHCKNSLFKDVINNKWTCSKTKQFLIINFVKKDSRGCDGK
jgi:hypothetical protein